MKYSYLILSVFISGVASAQTQADSFTDFIARVVQYSPDIKANAAEEEGFKQEVRIARSGFLPKLDFEALDTSGFPASTSALGVGGVMGSPYRKGAAGGFTLTQELWDFGRTAADVETSKRRLVASKFSEEVTLEDIKTAATSAYFNCARESASVEVWQESVDETEQIHREVLKFTRTGQRSVVDEKLSLLEAETAARKFESTHINLVSLKNKMNVLLGEKLSFIRCLGLSELQEFKAPIAQKITDSPQVLLEQARIKIAESELNRSKADYLPSLVGFASVGFLEDRRLVNSNDDYSLGIGLMFPLFEGFRVDASVSKAAAHVSERQEIANSRELQFKLDLESLNASINVARAEVARLNIEVKDAEGALKLAKTRYFKFQGTLIDLREAQRAVVQVKLDLVNRLAAYLFAQSEEAILSRTL